MVNLGEDYLSPTNVMVRGNQVYGHSSWLGGQLRLIWFWHKSIQINWSSRMSSVIRLDPHHLSWDLGKFYSSNDSERPGSSGLMILSQHSPVTTCSRWTLIFSDFLCVGLLKVYLRRQSSDVSRPGGLVIHQDQQVLTRAHTAAPALLMAFNFGSFSS